MHVLVDDTYLVVHLFYKLLWAARQRGYARAALAVHHAARLPAQSGASQHRGFNINVRATYLGMGEEDINVHD